MDQRRKDNLSGITMQDGSMNDRIITEVLSLWLSAIIVCLFISVAFPL